jgi:hypothetical protein
MHATGVSHSHFILLILFSSIHFITQAVIQITELCFSKCRHSPVTVLFHTPKHSSWHPVLKAPPPSLPFNQPLNSIINVPSLPARSHSEQGTGPPSLPLPCKEQFPVRCIVLQLYTLSAPYLNDAPAHQTSITHARCTFI